MAYELAVKVGDMFPDVEVTVLDENSEIVDVTGAIVAFSMRKSREPATAVLSGEEGVLVDPPEGKIAYRWQSGDTEVAPGTYEGEFQITPSVGDKFRFPTAGYITIHIEEHV